MNSKLIPKLIVSIISLSSVLLPLRAFLSGKIDMFLGGSSHTVAATYESTMVNTDPGFYVLLIPILLFGLILFSSCTYDIWKKDTDFKKWQAIPLFGMLGMWGVLSIYMYNLK